MQKLRTFEALKQKTGESLEQYADRLRKAAYGLNKYQDENIYEFYKSISTYLAKVSRRPWST